MNDRLLRCYAGWLAKLAGIRLGAPIEGWTYERIADEIGEIDGYITDLSRFAADDDSNGPMIFIRALNDYGLDATAEEIGRTWLNYTPYEHGMFWWGGYGVSTEHTAYLNLASGLAAPRSGSIAQNGAAVAEQIGGQIFIDTWGLVFPGSPARAAEYARRAASVSHDGNGVYGGMFVAAAVALAYDERNIRKIIEGALKYIPDNCEYARAVRAVAIFHDEFPDDWRECFKYVHDHWGYDRYPGNCHIIPNAAVMALAMYYGDGDFSRTLNICCMCGWDTDCNVGNVATILGVMNGLDGIDYDKWLAPINDGFAGSSVMGCLNYMDAPWCARYLDDLARRLAGEETAAFDACARVYDFELPGSTHSFESDWAALKNAGGCLECKSDGEARVFRRTYHAPDYFMDDRYSPEMTPELWPGQSVVAKVRGQRVSARAYARDMISGKLFEGATTEINGAAELRIDIPALDNACMERMGVAFEGGALYIDSVEIQGRPDYSADFEHLVMERHRDSSMRSLSQFTRFKGLCDVNDGVMSLSCADRGAIFTGDIAWDDYAFSARFVPAAPGEYELLARVQGALRSVSVSLGENGVSVWKDDVERRLIARCDHEFETGREYFLKVECSGDDITVSDEKGLLVSARVPGRARGAVGFGVRNGGRILVKDFQIRPLAE
jgi:ADP-ribosylglycohydrolase